MKNNNPTTRIRLRPPYESDGHTFFAWVNDRDLVLNSSAFYPTSEREHATWLESILTRKSDRVFLVIESTEDNSILGYCQLLNLNSLHGSAELSIKIGDKASQGKGYGSLAVQHLLSFAFKDLNLHRVYLNVFVSNEKAIRVYEKCGFKKEGLLREVYFIDGKRVDSFIMSILVNEYES